MTSASLMLAVPKNYRRRKCCASEKPFRPRPPVRPPGKKVSSSSKERLMPAGAPALPTPRRIAPAPSRGRRRHADASDEVGLQVPKPDVAIRPRRDPIGLTGPLIGICVKTPAVV